MSDKIIIPNSGGITIPRIKNFQNFKNTFHNYHKNYPGDYSFNAFVTEYLRIDKSHSIHTFVNYLSKGGVVPSITPIKQGEAGTGTINNPKGGKVLKVAYFDKLKTVWGRYDSGISLTDFELNEFLINLLRKIPNFNLETYLKTRADSWKKIKLRFPSADTKNFKGQSSDDSFNIYYQDTPIEVFGEQVSEKFNDRVRKALGLSTSFPLSLQSTWKKYSIPGADYTDQPSSILNEFEIIVSNNQSFRAKFRDIFKSTIVTFTSAAQCNRWLASPNPSYWPQQLNFAVWCATSGCGICLNENYPKRIQEFINFHIYFTIRRLLWELKIPLPDDAIFNQTSNHYDKIDYQRLCQEFNIDQNSDFRFRIHTYIHTSNFC